MANEIPHSKPSLSAADVNAVVRAMQSGHIAEGGCVNRFRDELSLRFQQKKVFLTNTGSAAIFLALKLLSIRPGDEVVLPTYVCSDVLKVVYAAEANPVLCDIGQQWNTGYEEVSRKVSSRTKAVIIPHNLGIQAETGELDKLGIPIIEDCCQCFGPTAGGAVAGKHGHIAVLSFQATKCLTTGEGGAVVINKELPDAAADVLGHFSHIFRMSDLQACLGVEQIRAYDQFLNKRKMLTDAYLEWLPEELTAAFRASYTKSVFFRFLIYGIREFETFRKFMQQHGVHVRKGIDALLHRDFQLRTDEDFPKSVEAYCQTASLPLYPSLSEEDVYRIAGYVNKYWHGNRTIAS